MKLLSRVKDSFPVGLIIGFLSLFLFYFLFNEIRKWLIAYYNNPYLLKPPAIQLFTMMVNIILFRIVLINLSREKTGKGILFITVIITLAYFYFYFRMSRQ